MILRLPRHSLHDGFGVHTLTMYQKRELDDCRGRSFLLVDHRCSLGQCSQDLNRRIARITTTEIAYGGTDCCSSVVLNTGASNYISRSLISREKPILGRKPQPCPMSKSIIIAIYNGICNYPHQPPKRVWDCFDDHLSQLNTWRPSRNYSSIITRTSLHGPCNSIMIPL